MNDPLVEIARDMATKLHFHQMRKYTGLPYISHCAEVADILTQVKARPQVIAAGWLHDTIEDCGATVDLLAEHLGADVARLVFEVTDVSRPQDGNRETRKAIDRDHLAGASAEGQTIKLADLISNTSSIVKHDPDFAKIYLREKIDLLKVLTKGDSGLHMIATSIANRGCNYLGMRERGLVA